MVSVSVVYGRQTKVLVAAYISQYILYGPATSLEAGKIISFAVFVVVYWT